MRFWAMFQIWRERGKKALVEWGEVEVKSSNWVTHSNDSIFGTSGEELAVRAEGRASNVVICLDSR